MDVFTVYTVPLLLKLNFIIEVVSAGINYIITYLWYVRFKCFTATKYTFSCVIFMHTGL